MKMRWIGKNQREPQAFKRKDDTNIYVSRRREIDDRKKRKKGWIK